MTITLNWTSYEGREELYAPPEDSDEIGGLRTNYYKLGTWHSEEGSGNIEVPCNENGESILTDEEIVEQWHLQT